MALLGVGQIAPNFKLPNQNGEVISLKELLKNGPVAIYFYPKALTPGCTTQACAISEGNRILKKLGLSVVGISADPVSKLKKFEEKYHLNFTLLSDESKEVIKSFGAWGAKKFMGKSYEGILRVTFVINSKGIITHLMDKVKTKTHLDDLIEIVK